MSVVIVGGNECMTRRYADICAKYRCKSKVYPKMKKGMLDFGQADLLILFTSTVSHAMVQCALCGASESTIIERSHSASATALIGILEKYAGRGKNV